MTPRSDVVGGRSGGVHVTAMSFCLLCARGVHRLCMAMIRTNSRSPLRLAYSLTVRRGANDLVLSARLVVST